MDVRAVANMLPGFAWVLLQVRGVRQQDPACYGLIIACIVDEANLYCRSRGSREGIAIRNATVMYRYSYPSDARSGAIFQTFTGTLQSDKRLWNAASLNLFEVLEPQYLSRGGSAVLMARIENAEPFSSFSVTKWCEWRYELARVSCKCCTGRSV